MLKASYSWGAWLQRTWSLTPSPVLFTAELVQTSGSTAVTAQSQALGKLNASEREISLLSPQMEQNRTTAQATPTNWHFTCLRQVRGRTFISTFSGGISVHVNGSARTHLGSIPHQVLGVPQGQAGPVCPAGPSSSPSSLFPLPLSPLNSMLQVMKGS